MLVQTLKGFRDFLPQEIRKRQFVLDTLRQVFETFNFEPLETPTLEYEEILNGKYGEEGDKLMYKFTDNGGRRVAMRYDLTVPLARVIAEYGNELPFPFKRYQMQNVYRADNTQRGRYREFTQCDIDIVGVGYPWADAQIIALAIQSAKNLGFEKPQIWINDREILDRNISDKRALVILDKLEKQGSESVISDLNELGLNGKEILEKINSETTSPRLDEIFNYLKNFGFKENIDFKFVPALARGLDYYTSSIFEMKILDTEYLLSVGGGGRYDNLVGQFINRSVPAVGFSFGIDRLIDVMSDLNKFENLKPYTSLLITVSNDTKDKSLSLSKILTDKKVPYEIYLNPEISIDKQLKYADKKGIPFVILFENSKLYLKDMKTGEKSEKNLEEIIQSIKS